MRPADGRATRAAVLRIIQAIVFILVSWQYCFKVVLLISVISLAQVTVMIRDGDHVVTRSMHDRDAGQTCVDHGHDGGSGTIIGKPVQLTMMFTR